MTPLNVYDFDRFVDEENWQAITDRFGFTQEQSICFDSYLKNQGSYNSYQTLGNLMSVTLSKTIYQLDQYLSL